MRSVLRVVLLCSVALSVAATIVPQQVDAPAAAVDAALPSFAGTWNTTFGDMALRQVDASVTGAYGGDGKLSGSVVAAEDGRSGARLEFRYVEPEERGEGWFELADDGRSFAGRWRVDGTETWQGWTGTLEATRGFDGLWKTSFGRMRLVQSGARVHGCYRFGAAGAKVDGSLDANGRYTLRYEEPNVAGDAWFELQPHGNTFRGKWRPDGDETWRDWTGTRVEPEPGVVWLVILEAHWETTLAESEYAFGDMLRSYFTMGSARHVRVRHRYFHDVADLTRFSAETAFLAEPVVLLLSTHGTPNGVAVAGETIGADAIAASLDHAGNLELLHLSGCDMMAGDVPRRILEQLPVGVRCPISGYTTTVDWAASAIADFTFLSMLLIRRLAPAEAVRQAHRAAPFTGESVPAAQRSVFVPLGLKILLPDALPAFDSDAATTSESPERRAR